MAKGIEIEIVTEGYYTMGFGISQCIFFLKKYIYMFLMWTIFIVKTLFVVLLNLL